MSYWEGRAATWTGACRAAWDEAGDGMEESVAAIAPALDEVGLAGGRILDLGCGPGRLLRPLSRRWPDAYLIGLDPSARMVEWARMAQPGYAQFVVGGQGHVAELHPLDGAYSMLTLQHLEPAEQRAYLQTVAMALVPGGVFRFQFVSCDGWGPRSHPVDALTMALWCEKVGMDAQWGMGGEGRPTWRWITAVKR